MPSPAATAQLVKSILEGRSALAALDGVTLNTGTATGIKIGGATTQKLGFYNATPVDQPATIADPAGGTTTDAEARAAIAAIIDALQELGLLASA